MDTETIRNVVKDTRQLVTELVNDGTLNQNEAEVVFSLLLSGAIQKAIESD